MKKGLKNLIAGALIATSIVGVGISAFYLGRDSAKPISVQTTDVTNSNFNFYRGAIVLDKLGKTTNLYRYSAPISERITPYHVEDGYSINQQYTSYNFHKGESNMWSVLKK